MFYVVSYVLPFLGPSNDEPVINILNENEFGTIMVPCQVMYKSDNFEEAEFYYNEIIK